MTCPTCGAPNHPDFAFCLQCGQSLGQQGGSAMSSSAANTGAETRADMMPLDVSAPATIGMPIGLGDGYGASPNAVRLRVEQGSVDEQEIPLDRPVTVIGRRQGSDVVIHDTNVSRQHAKIVRDGPRLTIEDTNSSNGTLVNDEKIEARRDLRSGDVVRIGDAVFVVEMQDAMPVASEGSTMAIDIEPSMTSIGGVAELVPPQLVSPAPAPPPPAPNPPQPAPLTPPPPIMESSYTAVADISMTSDDQPGGSMGSGGGGMPAAGGFSGGGLGFSGGANLFSAAGAPSDWSGGSSARPAPADARGPGVPAASSSGGSSAAALDSLRQELADVSREILGFSGTLTGLADRLERLERSFESAAGDMASVADVMHGPEAGVLRELQGILSEIERAGDSSRIEDATRVLEQLSQQPRDIELLLKLSQQAAALESALRVHGRLVAVAPRLRAFLTRIVS